MKAPYFLGAFAVYVGFNGGLTVVDEADFIDFCCFSASAFCFSKCSLILL
jgi:hypothetical protein